MLIFDLDGTLIDSNGVWVEVDKTFLARRGAPYTREYYEGVAHTILSNCAIFTKEYLHLSESCEEIIAEWMELAADKYGVEVPLKPHVKEYLERCRSAGHRMAVFTACVPEHCQAAMDHLGLTPYFERVIYAQEQGLDKKEAQKRAARDRGVAKSEVYRETLDRHGNAWAPIEHIERFAFYERARSAFLIVQTGDTRKYANLMLRKGCV